MEEVGHLGTCVIGFLQFGPDSRILGIAQDLAPLAAVIGDPGAAAGEADDGTLAVVGAEGAGDACFLGIGEVLQGIQSDK